MYSKVCLYSLLLDYILISVIGSPVVKRQVSFDALFYSSKSTQFSPNQGIIKRYNFSPSNQFILFSKPN